MDKKICIIAGSKSDEGFVKRGTDLLEKYSVPYEISFISAHRNLHKLVDYIKEKEQEGIEIFITVAGLAAHLPGAVASLTDLPVIGVPKDTEPLHGLDSLLSIVQMPRGIPVATMAVGTHGMINSCIMALRILSLKYDWAKRIVKKIREDYAQR